jgi:hypothetical protein
MIYIKRLTTEERATWSECPICMAPHGQPCAMMPGDEATFPAAVDRIGYGAHAARLFNAPQTAAIEDTGEPHGSTPNENKPISPAA